ncbi:MAG: O-linked N-acetylglucosamine transferase, SPINDLY family protein, partial [Chroococcidiopsidaceae cyanobacterium CP_BM_RX_35]|nr:O-linked N-acetylglucosamine transferase, SPINDLY family protein [Chroococcidiopsidaceae cyanobacterium CP_BM_RX_35]
MNWQQQVQECLLENRYDRVASLYEQAITVEPEVLTHHWHLGLAYLLQNQEEAAQLTWLSAMAQGNEEEAEQWAKGLVQILDAEAQRQAALENFQASWLIRQHIREIAPTYIDNILHLIQLTIDLGKFTPEQLDSWEVATNLQQASAKEINLEILTQILKKVLEFPTPETLAFVEACIPHYTQKPGTFVDITMLAAVKLAHQNQRPDFAANLAELCLKLKP